MNPEHTHTPPPARVRPQHGDWTPHRHPRQAHATIRGMNDNTRFWATLVGIGVALIIGVAAGHASTPQTQAKPAPRVTITITAAAKPASAKPSSTPTIGDGTWLIGTDMQPGTWRSPGNKAGHWCSWDRLSDTTGDLDAVIADETTHGPTVATLRSSDAAFKSAGCGTWTRQP